MEQDARTDGFGLLTDIWASQWRMVDAWTQTWLSLAGGAEPVGVESAIDRGETQGQLPVPNPIQASRDQNSFA